MAATALGTEPPRARFVSPPIWLGLDDFGRGVVARLNEFLHQLPDDAGNVRLTAAAVGPPDPDRWHALLEKGIDDLLADPRLIDQPGSIVPHPWCVCDLGGETADDLPGWLITLLTRSASERLPLAPSLLVRWLTRGSQAVDSQRVHRQIAALVDRVLAPDQPGHGKVTIFMVTDRDGANRIVPPADCLTAATYFAAATTFAATVRGANTAGQSVFHAPGSDWGDMGPAWESEAAFATFGVRLLSYPAAQQRAAWEAKLLASFAPVLDEAAPKAWRPRVPGVSPVDVLADLPWGGAPVLAWQPSLWRTPADERESVLQALAHWETEAAAWRRAELATFAVKEHILDEEYSRALHTYREQVASETQRILADDTLPGFFSPLERFLTGGLGAVRLSLANAPVPLPATPPAIEPPATALVGGAESMLAALDQRSNPRLLTLVAISSAIVLWLLLGLPGWLGAHTWLGLIRDGSMRWLRAMEIGHGGLAIPPQPRALTMWPGWFWRAIAIGLAATGVAWWRAHQILTRLDRAFAPISQQAQDWTDSAASELTRQLAVRSAICDRDYLHRVEAELEAQEKQLVQLRQAIAPQPPIDPVATPNEGDRWTRPLTPAAQPIFPTRLEMEQAVRTFRQSTEATNWAALSPPVFVTALIQSIAGDALPPDLRHDRLALYHNLAEALPSRSDLLAQLMPRAIHEERWHARRIVALPPSLIGDPQLPCNDAIMVPWPIEDQVLALFVTRGLTAADLFTRDGNDERMQ